MVALLLDRGADINEINKVASSGQTPLHSAVSVRRFFFFFFFFFFFLYLLMIIVKMCIDWLFEYRLVALI